MQWSELTTGERCKWLRGPMTQEQLAEVSGLSVGTIRKLEQGGTLTLASLIRVAGGLGTDVAVLVGQQAPRRGMDRDERAALRAVSAAAHDAAFGGATDTEPGDGEQLGKLVRRADAAYWSGEYVELGALLSGLLPEARAYLDAANVGDRERAAGVLADTYLTTAMMANMLGARDLANAALVYGRQVAVGAGDDMRDAHLAATAAWVGLRDGRTERAFALASGMANRVEPKMSDHDPDRLSIYGQLVTNAAVAASRGGASNDTARDYLSQAHATAALLGTEHARGGHAQPYGPQYVVTQAMSVAVATGDTATALRLIDTAHLVEGDVPLSTRARFGLDVALTHVECKRWELAAETLEEMCQMAPVWVRHQALPGVIIGRLAGAKVSKVRRLAQAAAVPLALR